MSSKCRHEAERCTRVCAMSNLCPIFFISTAKLRLASATPGTENITTAGVSRPMKLRSYRRMGAVVRQTRFVVADMHTISVHRTTSNRGVGSPVHMQPRPFSRVTDDQRVSSDTSTAGLNSQPIAPRTEPSDSDSKHSWSALIRPSQRPSRPLILPASMKESVVAHPSHVTFASAPYLKFRELIPTTRIWTRD